MKDGEQLIREPPDAQSNALPAARVIAFIDVLGFRQVVDTVFADETGSEFRRLLAILQDIAKLAESNVPGKMIPSDTRATAFSDSIVISDQIGHVGYMRVLSAASRLAADLLLSGVLCRGGITEGATFHNGRVVFGPGMIRAYEMETAAVYPRIILDDGIASYSRDYMFAMPIRDADGIWYLDPFYHLELASTVPLDLLDLFKRAWDPAKFETVRRHITLTLDRKESIGILAKYRWLALRFNEALGRYNLIGKVQPIELPAATSP